MLLNWYSSKCNNSTTTKKVGFLFVFWGVSYKLQGTTEAGEWQNPRGVLSLRITPISLLWWGND